MPPWGSDQGDTIVPCHCLVALPPLQAASSSSAPTKGMRDKYQRRIEQVQQSNAHVASHSTQTSRGAIEHPSPPTPSAPRGSSLRCAGKASRAKQRSLRVLIRVALGKPAEQSSALSRRSELRSRAYQAGHRQGRSEHAFAPTRGHPHLNARGSSQQFSQPYPRIHRITCTFIIVDTQAHRRAVRPPRGPARDRVGDRRENPRPPHNAARHAGERHSPPACTVPRRSRCEHRTFYGGCRPADDTHAEATVLDGGECDAPTRECRAPSAAIAARFRYKTAQRGCARRNAACKLLARRAAAAQGAANSNTIRRVGAEGGADSGSRGHLVAASQR